MRKLLIFAFALSALMVSCDDSSEEVDGQGTGGDDSTGGGDSTEQVVSFSAGITTRALADAFLSWDLISINSYSGTTLQDGYVEYARSLMSTSFDAVNADEAITIDVDAEESLSYVAVYPAQSSDTFTHTIAADQSGDGYETSDLMVAYAEASTATSVEFDFYHAFSQVNVTLIIDDQRTVTGSDNVIESSISEIYAKGSNIECNIISGAYTANSESLSISPAAAGSVYSAIVAPQTIAQDAEFFTALVNVGSGAYTWEMDEAREFKSGYRYDFEATVVVSDDTNVNINVEFLGASINDWGEETRIESIKVSSDGAGTEVYMPGSLQLGYTYTPAVVDDSTVEWVSTDTSVATVSSTGLVTGVGRGDVQIYARSTDGGNVISNYLTLYVDRPDLGFDVLEYTYPQNVVSGTSVTLYLTYGSANSWSVDSSDIISIGSFTETTVTVKFTGALGTAVLTVRDTDGNVGTVNVSVPAGYWSQEYDGSVTSSTMTNYVYSTPVPSKMSFNASNTGAANASYRTTAPYYVSSDDGDFIAVPIQRYDPGYQMYYFGSVVPASVGASEGYPYYAIHTEHLCWRAWEFTNDGKLSPSYATVNQTSVSGMNGTNTYTSYVYKTDRSPYSVTYLFPAYYEGTTSIDEDADYLDPLSEYISSSDYIHNVYNTHNVIVSTNPVNSTAGSGYILPDIPLFGARSFSSIEEYQEWAEAELGGKLVSSSTMNSHKSSTAPSAAAYYENITYADGTTDEFETFDSKQTYSEWKSAYSAWFEGGNYSTKVTANY